MARQHPARRGGGRSTAAQAIGRRIRPARRALNQPAFCSQNVPRAGPRLRHCASRPGAYFQSAALSRAGDRYVYQANVAFQQGRPCAPRQVAAHLSRGAHIPEPVVADERFTLDFHADQTTVCALAGNFAQGRLADEVLRLVEAYKPLQPVRLRTNRISPSCSWRIWKSPAATAMSGRRRQPAQGTVQDCRGPG